MADTGLRTTHLSAAQARRLALGAQGFGARLGEGGGIRRLRGLVRSLGLLQLDSVNVFERSHYLPAFSRLGAYDKTQLDRLTFEPAGGHTEYWAHEAAVIPLESWPLLRWRMDDRRAKALGDPEHWARSNRAMLAWLRDELAEKGPLAASAIEHDANRRRGPWWGWSDVKRGLEYLFAWGDVVSAGRTRFERRYALPEQVMPRHILDTTVERSEAQRQLIEIGARAHGVGTAADLADYFRMSTAEASAAIRSLEDEGVLEPVRVEGWTRGTKALPAWKHREATVPRRIQTTGLLSPFDPVVWFRPRAERLFNFHYRIEIYTPEPKRVYGYYSLPILLDDDIVGRVDLKSDRKAGILRVQSAWQEADAPAETAARLAPLLQQTAAWQGLGEVEVVDRGTLAPALAAELRVRTIS
ncbi:winged helix-turn-helix domain-containing protein [Salinibacterium sp. dk2585]|uniref:winged helix-turn-helix domain-containing protein n=1 Tax=unclassified Salinibacterium TaxID=2632331 RepID=UPI0011C24FE8|nr:MULTISPECIES: crosslink repair DNA glycosylase YcaQ family protein [unclassified Salinibacterium]QEE61935.1 winged helix-turn-helix domain-containing protein [Salinibacterium sp. dk2585]TXK54510.1 winged helix-turn-helix domain-containing protein [Salinibacterium sp. dk5596]